MPPVDLENLFACGLDRSVSDETQIPVLTCSASAEPPSANPNAPPESYLLPICSEIRWVKPLDRSKSTMGDANPKSNRSIYKPKSGPPRLATTARASKPDGPIIAVQTKTKRSIYSGNSVRPVTNFRFLPTKIVVIDGEWMRAAPDKVSPKVSCLDSVFSNKENGASRRRRSDSAMGDVEVAGKGKQCFASLAAILRYRVRHPAGNGGIEEDSSADRSYKYSENGGIPMAMVYATAPEVQSMKEFSSGKKTEGERSGPLGALKPLDREGTLGRR